MRTTNFDAIATAAPLNREASTVRDGSGDLWDGPALPDNYPHWKAPPKPTGKLGAGTPDYSGATYGRLTVIRYHGKSGVSKPVPTWLVRCACGDYELRRTKSVAKALQGGVSNFEGAEHSCKICEQVQIIRKRAARGSTKKSRKAEVGLLDRIAAGDRP